MSDIVEIEHLKRRFGACEAVNDLSLTVPPGSVFALLGPNAAGKTTTIKVMMNIIRPTAGHATVLGVDSRRLGPAEFRQIGYVSENQEIPTTMTVRDLLDYCRPLYPSWDADFAATLVRMLDIHVDRRISHLSRGTRMKAALVMRICVPNSIIEVDRFVGHVHAARAHGLHGPAGGRGDVHHARSPPGCAPRTSFATPARSKSC